MAGAKVVIVPGLRDHVPEHWQTNLAASLPGARTVPPMGRIDLDCTSRVAEIERVVQSIDGPVVLVAPSGGVVAAVHSANRCKRGVHGALLAAPADFEEPMPDGYPTMGSLRANGWLLVPQSRLPFPSIVAASRDDPLCRFDRAVAMSHDWGSRTVDLGNAGHLNPASGFGPWPQAQDLIAGLICNSN